MATEWMVRPASGDDLETVVEFNRLLAWESEQLALSPETLRAGVAAILGDPHKGRYFVACQGKQVVGQLLVTVEWSDWRNGEIWWIQSVYVRPEHRRQGVFRALHRHVEELARRDAGVVGLRLYVVAENHRARRSYEEVGMEGTDYVVMERMKVHGRGQW